MGQQQQSKPAEKASEGRARILDAALAEFSAHGLAGARTERIAAAAGVNKALLYYYFSSKEDLYRAVLESIATRIRESSMAVFALHISPGERILRTALNHFDRILGQPDFQSLLQQEMMRLHKNQGDAKAVALPILVEKVFEPLVRMFQTTMQEGMATGELVQVNWMQVLLAAMGANVFYFLIAPMWRLMLPGDPLRPEALAERRTALVEFLAQAIFKDRQRGSEMAALVLSDTPMPVLRAIGSK